MRISNILQSPGTWRIPKTSEAVSTEKSIISKFFLLFFLGLLFTLIGSAISLLGLYLLVFETAKYFLYNLILMFAGLLTIGFGQAFKCLVEIENGLSKKVKLNEFKRP